MKFQKDGTWFRSKQLRHLVAIVAFGFLLFLLTRAQAEVLCEEKESNGNCRPFFVTGETGLELPGFEGVGYVLRRQQFLGTAFLADNSGLVLTNAHIAILSCHLEACHESRLVFNDLQGIPHEYLFTLLVKSLAHDYALLQIHRDELDTLPEPLLLYIDADTLEEGTNIWIPSYGFNDGDRQLVFSIGKITDVSGIYYRESKPSYGYSADTEPGFSGSPVFAKVMGQYRVIAINWGHGDGTNYGTPLYFVAQDLNRFL